jgi:hypothetical protein
MPKTKRLNCEHQWPHLAACQPAFRNSYRFPVCGSKSTDDWSCACDGQCPTCEPRRDIEPHESEEIAACACDHLEGVRHE